jgi:hypothetical protein
VPNRSDAFTRADGGLNGSTPTDGGGAWTASGNYAVASNRMAFTATGTPGEVAWLESSLADGTYEATFPVLTGERFEMMFRYADMSNFWTAILYSDANLMRLYKIVGGSDTLVTDNSSVTLVSGDAFQIVLNGSAIDVRQNGVSRMTTTDSALSTNTKHGFRSQGGNVVRVDDFSFTGGGGGGGAATSGNLLLLGVG